MTATKFKMNNVPLSVYAEIYHEGYINKANAETIAWHQNQNRSNGLTNLQYEALRAIQLNRTTQLEYYINCGFNLFSRKLFLVTSDNIIALPYKFTDAYVLRNFTTTHGNLVTAFDLYLRSSIMCNGTRMIFLTEDACKLRHVRLSLLLMSLREPEITNNISMLMLKKLLSFSKHTLASYSLFTKTPLSFHYLLYENEMKPTPLDILTFCHEKIHLAYMYDYIPPKSIVRRLLHNFENKYHSLDIIMIKWNRDAVDMEYKTDVSMSSEKVMREKIEMLKIVNDQRH